MAVHVRLITADVLVEFTFEKQYCCLEKKIIIAFGKGILTL